MTEKEFLIKFLEFCYDKYNPLAKEYHPEYEQRLNEATAEFLMEHHKEYFEVEFVPRSMWCDTHQKMCDTSIE